MNDVKDWKLETSGRLSPSKGLAGVIPRGFRSWILPALGGIVSFRVVLPGRGRARAAFAPFFALAAAVFLFTALASSPSQAKYATLVIDADSGRTLQETNADTPTYPASLTKMMTLYLVFDALKSGKLKLDSTLKVTARAAGQAPTKIGLNPNDKITVEQGILSLVIRSANDVATAFSETLAPSEEQFALQMTAKARKLGMDKTTFRNASGLPHKGQMTTARDMARLARALLRDHPQYYPYFSRHEFNYKGQTIRTHNRMLDSFDGVDGIKTGYIRASGFNLVTSVKRDGHRLIGVVLGGTSPGARDERMAELLRASFQKYATGKVPAETVPETETVTAALEAAPEIDDEEETKEVIGQWGIQVGAFWANKAATEIAQKAISQAPRLLDEGVVKIVPLKVKGGRTLYRSRILGLSKQQAYDACRVLKKSQINCMEMRIKEDNAQMASTAR